jgi:rubrerythrin
MAHNAADAHALYLELAARAKTADCKMLYQRLAETEQRHLLRHTMRLRKLGHKAPKFRRSWLTRTWHSILASLAPTFAHKQLEQMRRGETRRQIELIRRQSDLRQTQLAAGD